MPRVLSTKPLSKVQQNLILNQGWSYVEYSAIKRIPTYSTDFFQDFSAKNVIITSPFTARILLKEQPSIENLFVVGGKTSKQLAPYYNIKEVANYGKELAGIIVDQYSLEKFTFLCGNLRKDEIPLLLNNFNISYYEKQLYKTTYNTKHIPGNFDAVIFCSPSAVDSYFKANQPELKTTYICIGTSTAKKALEFTNQIKIASRTSMESCIIELTKLFN